MGLILRNRGRLSGGPIRAREFHAPESRRRREEFDTHALALVRIVAEVHHPAFLLVLREGIGEDEKGSDLQLLVGVKQGAMRVDHNRFAGVLKPPALLVLAREQHPNSHEHPGTAAFAFVDGEGHDTFMVGQASRTVNLALGLRFSQANWPCGQAAALAPALHRKSETPRIGRRFREGRWI
jgi:hypothetical protein